MILKLLNTIKRIPDYFYSLIRIVCLFAFALSTVTHVDAQDKSRLVKGRVTAADDNEGMPGVNVIVKGTTTGTVTDVNSEFRLELSSADPVLVFSLIGYATQEVVVGDQTEINVLLKPEVRKLDEIVVVGYGEQKKESVVAAITQTEGKVLLRTGGVYNVSAALTGNLPGVITSASTGMPGQENVQILIRGANTWNNASPLIVVDGVERPDFLTTMDINSVETISVLKDASATAVYGSRGGNGVIIITTKRGKTGRANMNFTFNSTMKVPSKLPGKYDSYDALRIRNEAIENELSLNPNGWADYLPQDKLNKYRYPANQAEAERYPNVDWANTLFKNQAMSYNANFNISGGSRVVKYFTNADFQKEGDLFRTFDNNRGYKPGYGYNRLNVRSNLDFQLTPSTLLKTNLAGTYGLRKSPWGASGSEYGMWIAAYSNAPDAFLPVYSDGTWGYYAPNEGKAENSVRTLAISGIEYTTTSRLSTNFTLDQNLDKLVKGLNILGTLAMDNTFVEGSRGVNDLYHDTQLKWIDPNTGLETYKQSYDLSNRFDFQEGVKWSTSPGAVQNWNSQRKLFYQLQLKYAKSIADKHNITVMGLVNRNEDAIGSEAPHYREDWVFRTTYNFADKYMIEYNGAYNGSEQFSKNYRFAFFSSGGLGWLLSEEKFLKSVSFLEMFKVRASVGQIGNDRGNTGRWLFMDQWAYGGKARLGVTGEQAEQSPFTWYKQTYSGNPSVRWETATKYNLGIDYSLFNGTLQGNIDFFKDSRKDMLIDGSGRAIPSYYGGTAPAANLGKAETRGYEFVIKYNHVFTNSVKLWANLNMTHAKSKVLERDDAQLLPDYQKSKDKQIGQAYSYVSDGHYNTWDELYASVQHNTNDNQKLPGNYNIVDYNGDGVIDSYDNVPFGFSGTPQNTYNATIGFDWKRFSCFVQFYGVNNVTRQVVLSSLTSQSHVVYDEGSYWSKNNTNADSPMPRWLTTPSGYNNASRYMFDGSYVRLKNAEVAYTLNSHWVQKIGLNSMRIYINGNNLLVWTKMPDDRESNFAGTGWASQGAYPTVKRYNMGINLTF